MEHEITSKEETLLTYIKKVYKYKFLVYTLAIREVKSFYVNTYLGIISLVIQPLVALIIYTIFFDILLGIKAGDTPYPLFVFPGVMVWFHFIQIIYTTGSSLQNSQNIIHRIAFPKLILPLSQIMYSLLSVGISFILILIISFYYGNYPTIRIIFFPAIVLLNIIIAFSIGIWLSALTIKYTDLQNIIPFLCNFLIWISPVFYPSTIIPKNIEYIIYYNPITTVLCLYRWCLVGTPLPHDINFFVLIPIFITFICGVLYFKKIDQNIIDHI